MPQLAPYEHCTGCGACAFKCPKNCITMPCDSIGSKIPVVDPTKCIECGNCERACPALNLPQSHRPTHAYAAWNLNSEERKTSASGGIAAAIYKYGIEQGWAVVGASQNEDWSVTHKCVECLSDIGQFKNSKYVFSEPYNVYSKIKEKLHNGRRVIMIGLPCQIAAMKKLFPKNENLLLIDVVCHGIMPATYLTQHISTLEKVLGKKASRMSFRAPEKGTANYFFTLYDNDQIIYSKRIVDGDIYNIAFHQGIAYRENCYHCQYARPERASDITLGDYHGLGIKDHAGYDATDVSVVLTNTSKGEQFINEVHKCGLITIDSRPVEEPIEGDAQLRRPTPKPDLRKDFEKLIFKYDGNFVLTIKMVLRRRNIRTRLRAVRQLPKRIVKKAFRVLLKQAR